MDLNRDRFERHLDRLELAQSIKDKYEQVFDNLQRCRNIATEIAVDRAKKLQFMAFTSHDKVLLTRKEVESAIKPMFVRLPVEVSDNLVDTRCFKRAHVPQKGLRILDCVSVYSPADEHERPALSLLDIARQIPDNHTDDTKAVCLLLEDNNQQNGYDLVLMQYEYKVMLLG